MSEELNEVLPVVEDYDRRIADALERIASALEQANAARVWPTTQVLQTNGVSCLRCGTWIWNGTVHYCGTAIR